MASSIIPNEADGIVSATNSCLPQDQALLDVPVVLPTEATVVGRPWRDPAPVPPSETVRTLPDQTAVAVLETTCCSGRATPPATTIRNSPRTSCEPPVDRLIGTTVGRFRIESVIASGGMGTVYKAVQEHPVRRPVALKMIRSGMADENTLSRFLAERQVLALMDHADIARVYEADATADGNPYLAMEFCAGEPIDRFCERKRLNIRQRVEWVVRIARAVSRAHAHGVVHRDLKPDNILIAETGEQPQLKVIDFGIAKWTAEQPGLAVHATQVGELVGTPAYMSPEQALGNSDARTDVFAMGAILFKLLTGSTPLEPPDSPNPSLAELILHIRNFPGITPSQRFGSLPPTEQMNALRERCLEKPAHWYAAVRGDLDWITLRAIEPDRTRRYATASDLADDLERYLRHEAVRAAAPTRWYRWSKFYQRRKPLVWSVAVVLASMGIAAGISGYLWSRYEWQQWQETNRIATEAEVLLNEAVHQQRAAALDPLGDESAFVAARTTSAKAEALLQGRTDLTALQQSLSALQTELVAAQRGFELASSLDAARQSATEIGNLEAGDHFGRMAGLRQMREAWERFGVIPTQTTPATATQRIRLLPRNVQQRIIEGLDFLLYEDPFGAGLYLHQVGGRISVAEVLHGGGAERAAQLRPGDRILEIEAESLLEWAAGEDLRAKAYRLLAGKPQQRLRITFVRGLGDPVRCEVVCDGAAAHWASEVLAIVDPDPWRTKLRQAVLESDLPQLHSLSLAADRSAQPPFNLIQLAGTLFLLERSNDSLRFLEVAQQQHPQNFWTNHYLGTALAVAHDPPRPDLGLRYLTAAVSLRPDSPGARINLAETLLKLGQEEEAITHLETAKRLSPNHVPVERRLKSLLERARRSGDLELASTLPTKPAPSTPVASSEPSELDLVGDFDSLDDLEQRARHLASNGQRREALLLVTQAEAYHLQKAATDAGTGSNELLPETTASLRRVKGVVLLELQDFVAARVVLGDAARLNPRDAAARFYYGVALEYSGDSEKARHEYEAALEIRPDYEAVREFLRNLKQP